MITTTLAVLALAGGVSAGAGNAPSPNWQQDYAKALTVASSQRKPVAVFIGHGRLTQSIPPDAARLLKEKYVCVHLNTDTPSGKAMAGEFQLSEGLVISSPGGKYQALRHNGAVKGSDLTGQLTRYASAGEPSTTTTTGYSSTPVVVVGGTSNPGTIYQGGYGAPVYQPAPSYNYFSPYGGVCVGPR